MTSIISDIFNDEEDVFIVDSMPLPVCNIAVASRRHVLRENFDSNPDKGYSAITKTHFYGYKIHLITSLKGFYKSIDITKANLLDIHFLNDANHSGLNNCTLFGDKGYLSSDCKIDLFHTAKINLVTPKRRNPSDFSKYPYVFSKSRKRIETQFSQRTDQFQIKRNYAKSFLGFCTRI